MEKVVVIEKDLWCLRQAAALSSNLPPPTAAAEDEGAGSDDPEDEDDDENRETIPHADFTGDSAAASNNDKAARKEQEEEEEREEEDFEDGKGRLDSAGTIKELKAQIEQQHLRLKQERAHKLKVYEKQLEREVKDGMKRVLKKMLLQYHPDKINTLRMGEEPIQGTEEEVEAYLKDITQELARIMQTFGGGDVSDGPV
jgi:molecular chaperone GrpE (heat shock protein)